MASDTRMRNGLRAYAQSRRANYFGLVANGADPDKPSVGALANHVAHKDAQFDAQPDPFSSKASPMGSRKPKGDPSMNDLADQLHPLRKR